MPISNLSNDTDKMDIYLLLGQSNMQGSGALPDGSVPDPRILYMDIDSNTWVTAQHPLHHWSKASSDGVGPGLNFALEVRKHFPARTIGLVPCTIGGSDIKLWQKTSLLEDSLYNYTLKRAQLAKQRGTIRGILWLQGESDSGLKDRANAYSERLTRFVQDFRTDIDMPELPFICATIGSFLRKAKEVELFWPFLGKYKFPYSDQINDVLLGISNAVPNAACTDTRDITGHIGDYLHFNAASQELIGKRMAEDYLKTGTVI